MHRLRNFWCDDTFCAVRKNTLALYTVESSAVIEKTVTEEVVAGKVSSDDLNNIYKESTNETIYLDKPAFIELWFTNASHCFFG